MVREMQVRRATQPGAGCERSGGTLRRISHRACSSAGQGEPIRAVTVKNGALVFALLACPLLAGAGETSAGDETYARECAGCHGASLGGAFAAPLSGTDFAAKWAARGPQSLFALIRESMPPARPGGLSPQAYLDLTNLVLARNELPPLGTDVIAGLTAGSASSAAGGSESGGAGDPTANQDAVYRASRARQAAKLAAITPVDEKTLRAPPDADWLHWRRTDDGFGFSPLTAINPTNAHRLQLAWSLSLPAGTNQITPLVHDGVMFVNSNGTVQALDAVNGDLLWKFARVPAPVTPAGPPTTQPRNLALYGTTLFVPTLDNHMLALDARSGSLLWDHPIQESGGVLRLTGGPLVVHDLVLQGVSGCSGAGYAGGCFIIALDAQTGAERWRFNTVAHPGMPGGNTWNGAPLEERFGGSVWVAGTYDAELDLVYFGTGQTYHITPLMRDNPNSEDSNDALYTDTTLALNPRSGELVWHYQHQAREVWDLDWAFERTILTLPTAFGPVKAVVTMGKLGILDALDARTGAYLSSFDLGLQNLVVSIDSETGAKTTDPALEPAPDQPRFICPFPGGVRSWPATAYDPARGLLFVSAFESCMEYVWKPGEAWDIQYTVAPHPDADGNFGRVAAIDLGSGKVAWEQRRRASQASAMLATASGLVFEGSRDRWFRASDSASGEVLWQARLDMTPNAFPITYASSDVQYVAITTGGGGPVDVSWQTLTPELQNPAGATTLWVFHLGREP